MVRAEHVPCAATLEPFDERNRLAADQVAVAAFQRADIQPADERLIIAVGLGDLECIDAGFDFHRVQRVEARIHDHR